MKISNILKALYEQGPPKRFFRNFFITRNAWGMFSKLSHTRADGKDKVSYSTRESAQKAAEAMKRKQGKYFSAYKCIYCDGYHIGSNRNNK